MVHGQQGLSQQRWMERSHVQLGRILIASCPLQMCTMNGHRAVMKRWREQQRLQLGIQWMHGPPPTSQKPMKGARKVMCKPPVHMWSGSTFESVLLLDHCSRQAPRQVLVERNLMLEGKAPTAIRPHQHLLEPLRCHSLSRMICQPYVHHPEPMQTWTASCETPPSGRADGEACALLSCATRKPRWPQSQKGSVTLCRKLMPAGQSMSVDSAAPACADGHRILCECVERVAMDLLNDRGKGRLAIV
jgi:hypothetical protein